MANSGDILDGKTNEADYLNMLVGGPQAYAHASEVGGFAASHVITVEDLSSAPASVEVHATEPRALQPLGSNIDAAEQT